MYAVDLPQYIAYVQSKKDMYPVVGYDPETQLVKTHNKPLSTNTETVRFVDRELNDCELYLGSGIRDGNNLQIYDGQILRRVVTVTGKQIEEFEEVSYRDDYAGFYVGETPLLAYMSNFDSLMMVPCTYPVIVGHINTHRYLLEGE